MSSPKTTIAALKLIVVGLFRQERAKLKGEKGDKGERGEVGLKGAKGDQGPQGERGEKGPRGAEGKQGERGAPGRDGADGRNGADGRDGAQGPEGRPGIAGKDAKPPEESKLRTWFVDYVSKNALYFRGPMGPRGDVGPANTETAISVNAQTGTSYTLQASDQGKTVTLSNGSAITLTVPAGLGAGFNCLLVQLGAGQVTVAGSGATVNSRGGATKLNGQYAEASLVAYAANTFVLAGDVTT